MRPYMPQIRYDLGKLFPPDRWENSLLKRLFAPKRCGYGHVRTQQALAGLKQVGDRAALVTAHQAESAVAASAKPLTLAVLHGAAGLFQVGVATICGLAAFTCKAVAVFAGFLKKRM